MGIDERLDEEYKEWEYINIPQQTPPTLGILILLVDRYLNIISLGSKLSNCKKLLLSLKLVMDVASGS